MVFSVRQKARKKVDNVPTFLYAVEELNNALHFQLSIHNYVQNSKEKQKNHPCLKYTRFPHPKCVEIFPEILVMQKAAVVINE